MSESENNWGKTAFEVGDVVQHACLPAGELITLVERNPKYPNAWIDNMGMRVDGSLCKLVRRPEKTGTSQ